MIRATITPCNCDNPNHAQGCGLGWHLVHCEEHEAHTWVASIFTDETNLWGSSYQESTSREAATEAMLKRLAEGVEYDLPGLHRRARGGCLGRLLRGFSRRYGG